MDVDRHLEVTIERPEPGPADDPPRPPGTRRITRLHVALALAVTVAVVLAGALYYTRHQTDTERKVTEAIVAYTAAWNAHDVAAVRAAMLSGGSFVASDNIEHEAMLSAGWGPDLDRLLTVLFAADVRLETRSRVLVAGDSTRASVAQRFSYTVYGVRVVEDGISNYTLSPVGYSEYLKVVQHVWWRPRPPRQPSMLWLVAP